MEKTDVILDVSARHVHLRPEDVRVLFGKPDALTLRQGPLHSAFAGKGQEVFNERVEIVGPKGSIKNVTILGPLRNYVQVEVSMTDTRTLGVEAVVRKSGMHDGTPGNCLKCEEECMSGALTIWGKKMTVDDAMDVIRRDREFYERSGGGVTLSGGEALLQWQFCRDLLKRCKEEDIHTCVESALHVNPKAIDEVAPYIDLFITDIKQMDSTTHKKFTGVGNELILSNIKKLVEMDMPLIIRMPIIPGFNDNETYIDATANFILNELHNKPVQIQMLKYRPLGEEKAGTLGLPLQMKGMTVEDGEGFELQIRSYVKQMNDRGIPAIPGTKKKKEKENE